MGKPYWQQSLFACVLVCFGCGRADEGATTSTVGTVQSRISGIFSTVDNTTAVPFVAPVGFLSFPGGGFCSGTAVTPTKVLTAGHCFNGRPQNAGTFELPRGNKVSVQFGTISPPPNFTANIVAWTRITNEIERAHDIAIATLGTAVPAGIVPFPHVFTGDIAAGVGNGDIRSGAQIVGFGDTVVEGLGNPDGNRRFTSEAPDLEKHSCDFFAVLASPFGFNCNDNWQWEQWRPEDGIQPEPESGDSGSPLYMPDRNGRLMIVGVDQGEYDGRSGRSTDGAVHPEPTRRRC